jgi:hypothetical protein
MKVKIDNKIYSAEDQPIMVILTDGDKYNISHMAMDATKYAAFPDNLGWSIEEKLTWMGKDDSQ